MKELEITAQELINVCKIKNLKLGTAESCTGGLISATITSISGSSAIYDLGYITYSNQSKVDLLKVNQKDIEQHGAVSKEVCSQMSSNLIHLNPSIDLSIAVSGIAGPKSDETKKEVGLVYIAISANRQTLCNEYKFGDIGRDNVRYSTTIESFKLAHKIINQLYS